MALTTNQMSQIQLLLAHAEGSDWAKIAQMFNTTRRLNENAIKNKFAVGQKVSWLGKRGFLSGEITKINRKNIVVNAGADGMWNVAPSLLQAA